MATPKAPGRKIPPGKKDKGDKCTKCPKPVGEKEEGVQCEICQLWRHAKCIRRKHGIILLFTKMR